MLDLFSSPLLRALPSCLVVPSPPLRRRQSLEGLRNLLLPLQLGLAIDFGADVEILAAFRQQGGTEDDGVWAHDLLMVVDVGGAVWAIVAVDRLATVTLVGVLAGFTTLGDLESRLGDDLRRSVSTHLLGGYPKLGTRT